jgi:RNA-directed DNA polymerase
MPTARRNARQAVVEVEELLFRGHPDVADTELADYYESIPMPTCSTRSGLGSSIGACCIWSGCGWIALLKKPTIEVGRRARPKPGTSGAALRRAPPISLLLANIYMRRFVLGWKMFGFEWTLGTRLATYADLVILCGRGKGEEALQWLREIMGKLKLTVNEKTRVRKAPGSDFDFLGYTADVFREDRPSGNDLHLRIPAIPVVSARMKSAGFSQKSINHRVP